MVILTTLIQRLCGSLWPYKDGAPKPKELVAPKPNSWFMRQKVLGANIHETEGLLERNIVTHSVLGVVCDLLHMPRETRRFKKVRL